MAGTLEDHAGGIYGLLELPEDTWGALEADLLAVGYQYDDIGVRLSWRAVLVQYQHSRPGSSVHEQARRDHGDLWSREAHLTAMLIDEVRMLRWTYVASRTPKGKPIPERPKPFPRPGVVDTEGIPAGEGTTHIGYGAIPMSDFESWWESAGAEKREAAS